MATTMEIVRGISQVMANSHDGALDDNGEPIKVGLKREEGDPITDSRIMDGFKVSLYGNQLCLHYHSEINIKDVKGDKLEGEIEQMIADIAKFLKKEYKRITGNTLTLTKDSDLEARMEYMNRIRCWVMAHQYFKIGGIKDVEGVKEPSEDRLEKDFKNWLEQDTTKRPKNDTSKDKEPPKFMPWNLKR